VLEIIVADVDAVRRVDIVHHQQILRGFGVEGDVAVDAPIIARLFARPRRST